MSSSVERAGTRLSSSVVHCPVCSAQIVFFIGPVCVSRSAAAAAVVGARPEWGHSTAQRSAVPQLSWLHCTALQQCTAVDSSAGRSGGESEPQCRCGARLGVARPPSASTVALHSFVCSDLCSVCGDLQLTRKIHW